MAETIREQLIQAVIARAEPLSDHPVLRCKRPIIGGDTGDDRLIAVWDGVETVEEGGYGDSLHRLEITIIAAEASDEPSVSLNAALGEIISTLAGPGTDQTFGNLAESFRYTGSFPDYQENGDRAFGLRVTFSLTYRTALGNPYSS